MQQNPSLLQTTQSFMNWRKLHNISESKAPAFDFPVQITPIYTVYCISGLNYPPKLTSHTFCKSSTTFSWCSTKHTSNPSKTLSSNGASPPPQSPSLLTPLDMPSMRVLIFRPCDMNFSNHPSAPSSKTRYPAFRKQIRVSDHKREIEGQWRRQSWHPQQKRDLSRRNNSDFWSQYAYLRHTFVVCYDSSDGKQIDDCSSTSGKNSRFSYALHNSYSSTRSIFCFCSTASCQLARECQAGLALEVWPGN